MAGTKAAALGVALGIALGLFAGEASAMKVWVYLNTSAPEGTPPSINLDPSSTPQQTILDITIHGFWMEEVPVENVTFNFQKITFDGWSETSAYEVVGQPDLPAINLTLANLSEAEEGTAVIVDVEMVMMDLTAGIPLYPVQLQALDNGDPPPPFQWDQDFYNLTTGFYPIEDAGSFTPMGIFAGLQMAEIGFYPIKYSPAINRLQIMKQVRIQIDHAGPASIQVQSASRRQVRQFETLLANYPVVEPFVNELEAYFPGDFLFITPPIFLDEIQPLVDQKIERGYDVDVMTTDQTGTTCEDIRTSIENWYYGGDEEADRYIILVGDSNLIPQCTDKFGHESDRVYVCIEGTVLDGQTDPFPEARLGRFPAADESELTNMIAKTLTYEGGYPMSGQWLDNVLLAAHKEEYPGKYTQAQEDVRLAQYSVQPDFQTAYGAEGGSTNSGVRNAIDEGLGVVCYRGHGSATEWWFWNYLSQHFDNSEVALLDNGVMTPVVFSICCQNNRIQSESIGENWLAVEAGAVAHYAASFNSWTDANHTLDFELFRAIYRNGQTLISEAILAAEIQTIVQHQIYGEENTWMYFLCGDPELKVWRKAPKPPMLSGPPEIPPGPGQLLMNASDPENGRAIEGVLVTVPVHGPNGEYGGAYYTDASGAVTIPVDGTELSLLYQDQVPVSTYDEFTDWGVARELISLQATSSAPDAAGVVKLSLGPARPNPSAGRTSLRYTLPNSGHVSLAIFDVRGRRVATLFDGIQTEGGHDLVWTGLDGQGRPLGNGVYFMSLEYGGEVRTSKIVLSQ